MNFEIRKDAIAGTLESSDLIVRIEKTEDVGMDIILKSTVEEQFGDDIIAVVQSTLEDLGITQGRILIDDKGALDCTIIARVKTAVYRACEIEKYSWEVKNAQ